MPKAPTDFPPRVRKLVCERSGGVCERCGKEPAIHHHHRRLRNRTGPGATHGPANDFHVGARCHANIHHWPRMSEACGWMVATGLDPAEYLVLYRSAEWVLLDTEGGVVRPASGHGAMAIGRAIELTIQSRRDVISNVTSTRCLICDASAEGPRHKLRTWSMTHVAEHHLSPAVAP